MFCKHTNVKLNIILQSCGWLQVSAALIRIKIFLCFPALCEALLLLAEL